jgi:polar amino acid transport system permease protein
VEAFAEWFQQFYESTGWNFVFMYDEYERDRLVEAIWVTIKLSLNCLLFSLIVGVVGAWAQGARVAWVRHTVYWYIQAFRNTPPLVRSGIEAVPTATIEAAESLGYSRLKAYIYIVMPLAFRVSLPALNNNLVNLVKTTTLAYVIAVPEMMYTANQMWSDNVNVTEMMIVLFVYYVGLVAILVYFMHRWERSMKIPGYGA